MAVAKITTKGIADDAVTSVKLAPGAVTENDITDGSLPLSKISQVNLDIAPEILEIQVSAPAAGQATTWLWTWEQSTLPYARRTITNSPEVQVPLYKQGTYTVNNFAAYDIFDDMTQTHSLYLKWIDGAGTDNLVSWAVDAAGNPISDSHPDINGGAATDVQRINISVPSTITPPTLTAPSVSYTVVNNGTGAYTFSGSASGDNPNIGPFYRGGTYTINITASGHPFYFTTDNGTNFTSGTYFGEYTDGVTGSRTDSGTITFTVPNDAPDTLYYQCGNHSVMRGAITVKDLAVETNNNGNYIVYFQHTQEGHKTPVEIRPIPSLVNQMCLVYDASSGKFVPQDLATYVENTPSFENKIREVAGTAELVVEDGSAVVAKVNVYDDSTYLPLVGNNAGDQAFATDVNTLFIWDGTAWESTKGGTLTDINATGNITAGGDLTVDGNLTVNGTTTTINSTTLTVDDLNIVLASGAANSAGADGAGITVDGANATLTYVDARDSWELNKRTQVVTSSSDTIYGNHQNELVIQNADSTTNNWSSVVFRNSQGTAAGDISMQHTNHSSGYGKMQLSTRSASGYTPKLTINDKKVGINTDVPGHTLHVEGDVSGDWVSLIENIHTSNGYGLKVKAGDNNDVEAFRVANTANDSLFSVKSGGYVGIGTATPDRTFHVKSTSSSVAKFETSSSSYAGVELKNISGVSDGDTAGYLYGYSGSQFLGGIKFVRKDSNSGEIVLRQQVNSTNTDVVTISDGSVGIGTDSPARKLHVNGSGRFDMAAGTVRISEQESMVSVQGVNNAETAFADLKIDGSKVILQAQSGGTVGIDNASPGHYLHIGNTNTSDSTKRYGIRIERHGNSTSPGVWDNSSGQGAIQISDTSGNGPATVENNSGVLMMGFGRMSPSDSGAENASIINVTYDGSLGPMRLDGKGNIWTGYDRGTAETNTNDWQGIFRGGILVGSNSTYRTGNADGGALIQGNVAIGGGNGTPARRLDVRGGTDYQQVRLVSVNQGSSAGIEFTDELGFSQMGYFRWTHSDGNTATNTGQSGNASFVIGSTEADNVIGFNSGMTDTGYGNNRGSIKYTSSGTTYNTTSDRRLKENIELITDGKEKLLAMKPSTFNFINDENKTKMHGFIAQEMQEVIPEAVSDGTTMGMDYGRITPVIVAALQDALREIEDLKIKIQNLENNND